MKFNIKILLVVIFQVFILIGCKEKESQKTEEKREKETEKHSKLVKLNEESLKLIKIETEAVSLKPLTGYITLRLP